MIALLVMTDGRDDLLDQALASAADKLVGPITERIINDDTGDFAHRQAISRRYPDFSVLGHPHGRQGFGGAIRNAWGYLRHHSTTSFVFHLEDDFTFNHRIDLAAMASTLIANPQLVQLALRRQPWNDEERAAGGIVEAHPDDFVERHGWAAASWLEHRRFFTTNPSLYRRRLVLEHDWPAVDHSEGVFTHQLLADPAVRFGYWGSRASGEAVTHLGHERAGVGY